jgi:hypothetical protein
VVTALALVLVLGGTDARGLGLRQLEPSARKQWPQSFAGLWQAHGKVFIAFTERPKRRTHRLRLRFAKPGRLRAVHFEHSLAELEATQEEMIADRENRPPGTVGFPTYDLDLSIQKNAPVATFEHVTPQLVAGIKSLYGQEVIVKQGPLGSFDSCSRSSCAPYLRSGLRTIGPSGSQCSTAFAVQQHSAAYKGVLSAGHCGGVGVDDEGAARFHGDGSSPPQYGIVDRSVFQDRVDAEVHKITNASFSRRPWIFDSSKLTARPVQRVSDWNWVRPGMAMCKSGIKTGKTCGKVLSRYYSPGKLPGAERFVRTNYCADHGDSGAGVYIGAKLASGETVTTAYGIHSGGPEGFECTPGKPLQAGDYSFFGHIQYAQVALGVRVQLTS